MLFRITSFIVALCLFPLVSFSDVVINEINYDPIDIGREGGSLREFIEIYNPGPNEVDLSGYAFTAGITYTFPQATRMSADSYLVLARVPTHRLWSGVSSPVLGPYDLKLSNGGEKLTLVRPDGTLVEQFRYNDDFPWPRGADGYGPSMERIAWDLPANDFHSWRASFNEGGTPGRANSVANTLPRPFLHSVDVFPKNPSSVDTVQISMGIDAPELIQQAYLQWDASEAKTPDGIVNTDDWWHYWKGTSAPSDGLEWTQFDFDASSWSRKRGAFGYGDLSLVNTPLIDMRGNYTTFFIRHHFTIDDPSALNHLSLNILFDDGFICYLNGKEVARSHAPEEYTHTSTSVGSHEASEAEIFTLGAASDLLQQGDNVIALVGFNITLGNSTDFVLAPFLLSSKQSSDDRQIPMTFSDAWIGGATYQATIPAQPNQSLVRFNLKLDLMNGQTLLLPHTTERKPFGSYFVYDHDIPTYLPILWLFENKVTQLPERSSGYSAIVVKPLGDDPIQVFDGATITPSRNGHKLKFLKSEEFRGDRTINLSLEAPREGTTAGGQSPHVEQISYDLFRDFGVLTPRCDWYRVIEKNTHSQRIAVQQPNERFLEINDRNPDGNLYKIAYNEPGGYSKKSNLDEGDDDFHELFQHVSTSNPRLLAEDILSYLDYEEVMGYEVATYLLSHWDGIKNNIFLYHDLEDGGKWEIIPWDVDKTFGYTDSNSMYWEMPIDFFITGDAPGSSELTGRNLNGPITRPFHSVQEYQHDFVNRVTKAMEGLFSLNRVGGIIDSTEELLLDDLGLIEDYTSLTNDRRRNQITSSYETMRFFLKNRHAFLRTQMPTDFTVGRSLPSANYHSGETLQGIKITVLPLANKTIQAQIIEQTPEQFTVSNIQTTHGEATLTNNTITWTISDVVTPAELTYDLTVPETDPPMAVIVTGTMTIGETDYPIGDSELRYLPDNINGLSNDWMVGVAGSWMIIDGVLNCYAESSHDPKHAWVNRNFGTGDYTVKADVRMLLWAENDQARAGIAVRVNPNDGERALNLLFHNDQGSVDMLNDLVAWGEQGEYQWELGEWYTMILTARGSVLEGQFSKSDSNEEPLILTWDDPNLAARSPGFPGLTGSSMEGLISQYDNFEVIIDGEVAFSDDFNGETPVNEWFLY